MKSISVILIAALLALAIGALNLTSAASARTTKDMSELPENAQTAVFAGGCFWCTEAVFERIDGVLRVESGYMGGTVENPTYKQITTGKTGHAEVIMIDFDPDKVSYEQLVGLHFISHDPTTLNRQGADVGTQYRSAIFTYGDEQQAVAQRVKEQLEASGEFRDPIVTEITPASTFYIAEDYHQDFYNNNPYSGYCQVVIKPKLKKLGLE